MSTVLEVQTTSADAKRRPTREECIQDAGAAWARIRQMYPMAQDVSQEAAA